MNTTQTHPSLDEYWRYAKPRLNVTLFGSLRGSDTAIFVKPYGSSPVLEVVEGIPQTSSEQQALCTQMDTKHTRTDEKGNTHSSKLELVIEGVNATALTLLNDSVRQTNERVTGVKSAGLADYSRGYLKQILTQPRSAQWYSTTN